MSFLLEVREKWALRPKFVDLNDAIEWYSRLGYTVTSQTDTTAQMEKRKQFSIVWCLVTVVVPYLLYHVLIKQYRQVFIRVDGDKVTVRK